MPRSTKPMQRKPMKRGGRIKPRRKKSRMTKDKRTILEGADYTALLDAVYERDKGMCQVCPELGRRAHFISRIGATLDHEIPRGNGGCYRDDTPENTRLCCWLANSLKGSRRRAK